MEQVEAVAEDGAFDIHVAVGSAGMLSWQETQVYTVSVRPTDTLAQVFASLRERELPAPPHPESVRVAPSPDMKRVWSHHKLPHPRGDATVAENGLTPGCILRWVRVKKD